MTPDDVRCLSVRQPMASALAAGVKRWENRSRRMGVGRWPGWVGLHASQAWWGELPAGLWPAAPPKDRAPRGVVLGAIYIRRQVRYSDGDQWARQCAQCSAETMHLTCPRCDAETIWTPPAQMHADPWASGPWCLEVTRYAPLPEPLPANGALLWRPPADIADAIVDAIRLASQVLPE